MKKEPREKTLKYPPIYYQIHTPIDLGMATQEAQGGSGETVGERERRVLARGKEHRQTIWFFILVSLVAVL